MSKKEDIILIGGGGHCLSCIEVIESTNKYNILGILDANKALGEKIGGYKVLGSDSDIKKLQSTCDQFAITIGQIKSPDIRKRIFLDVLSVGGKLPAIIASTAVVSSRAKIGQGTIVMHQAVVNANAVLGDGTIINTRAIIEHEAVIGNDCHISTGAIINGQVEVGNRCFIGSGTVIRNNVVIGSDITIGMGSSVTENLTEPGTYVGSPAKKLY